MLIYSKEKRRMVQCNELSIRPLYMWSDFSKISTAVGFKDCHPSVTGKLVGWAVVSDIIGVVERFDNLQDAEDEIFKASEKALRSELVVFEGSYLENYPVADYFYSDY